MAITQPGDTTVISALSVPGDAGPAMRAESVQGGFAALTGSGPPDTTRLPLVMRRIGQFAYTPTDNKFWQLIGGVADANWVEKTLGKGGLVTVATNADRDALPSSVKSEGMIVYSQQTQCYYSLGADLATWTFIDANPALNTQANWYVNAGTGSDVNDGKTSGTALATLEELCKRLNPVGRPLKVAQNTAVFVAAGTYNALELSITFSPTGTVYSFDVFCAFTSGSPITLSSVTDTVPSATPTRGNIQTASGTFVDKARIRSTSGASIGAVTYCTGLNGGATNAWVKRWNLDAGSSGMSTVNIASGTTCVVDTLGVTINRVQIKTTGHRFNGLFRINDAILPFGADFVNAVSGSASIYLNQCQIGGDAASVARLSGNFQIRNCRVVGSPQIATTINATIPVFVGCVFEGVFQPGATTQLFNNNCVNGGSIVASGQSAMLPSLLSLESCEWVNCSGTAVTVGIGCRLYVAGQQFTFASTIATGYALDGGAEVVTSAISLVSGISATQPVTMAGRNVSYSELPLNIPRSDCSFILLSDPTAAPFRAPARFGATFYVDPAYTGFSDGTESNPYPSITAAIAVAPSSGALFKMAPYANSTENVAFPAGGVWEVQSEAEIDFLPGNINGNVTIGAGAILTLTNLTVTGTVTGATATAHSYLFLNNTTILGAVNLTTSGVGYWSLNAFTAGASSVPIDNGTFTSTLAVAGEIVVSNYKFAGAVSFTRASKFFGCTVNTSSIGVGGALLVENTTFGAAPTFTGANLVSMDGYSHASALAAGGITLAGGATLSLLNSVNPSGIQQGGATAGQALAWSGSAWAPASVVSGVSSVFGRVNAIIAALNDYSTSLIQNLSSVTGGGSTATSALNALQSQISSLVSTVAGLVTGVSSWNGRANAVMPASGDYNTSQITNASSVAGSTDTAALNSLLALSALTFTSVQSITANTTIGSTHANALLDCNNTSAIALTLPLATTHGLPAGTRVGFIRRNGAVTISHPGGVTLLSQSLLPPVSFDVIWELTYIGSDQWSVGIDAASSDDLGNGSSVSGSNISGALNSLKSDILAVQTTYFQGHTPAGYGVSIAVAPFANTGFSGGVTDDLRGTAVAGYCAIAVPLYPNVGLTIVAVEIEPVVGHTALPASMPFFQVWITSSFAHAGAGLVGIGTDSSTNVTDYEAKHALVVNLVTPLTSANAANVVLAIVDEGSTHALLGLRIKKISAYYG